MVSDVIDPVESSSKPATSGSEKKTDKKTVSAKLRGETMAYAAQSAIYNLGANFFEPYINYRVQKRYSSHDASHPGVHGNYTQNLAGEFAGDIIGSSSLILAEALIPEQLHACTRKMRSWIDPLYTSVAHIAFAKEKSEPGYEQKIEKWKTFQERNLVRSAIIATVGIAGNLATQKMLIKNPSPTGLIFAGKLASTSLTTAIGLGVRLAFPHQMKGVDRWMSKKIFAPMMQDEETPTDDAHAASHADRLVNQSDSKTLKPLR